MIERYTRPAIGAVWDEENKLRSWLRVELAVVEVLAERGVVPAEDAAIIRDGAAFTVEAVKEREKVTDHDVAAFVDVVVGPARRGWALVPPRADLLRRAGHGARPAAGRGRARWCSRARASCATR